MHPITAGMMQLFEGYAHAHGLYGSQLTKVGETNKLKGTAYSIKGDVTVKLWESHLAGEQAIGIIPITETSRVKFAAIDVDQYPCDIVQVRQLIERHKLPLIPFRTKSGGVHIYLFLTKFHDALPIQRRMREFASLLGFGNSEIFPKQVKILPERGDIGQWINMPYFNAAKTDRWALGPGNEPLGISDFIAHAMERLIDPLELMAMSTEANEILPGGPPCLNHLIASGFPEGSRNNGLFNLGIYAMKVDPDNWRRLLEQYNAQFMIPPLDSREVLGVMHSLNKKQFSYMCKQPPIVNYCQMAKCRQCKHGIGGNDDSTPRFNGLSKLMTEPPIWFVELEGGGRLELLTEDLQTQRRFQQACMSQLNIIPAMIKQPVWEEILRNLLETVTIVEMPPDLTPEGFLKQHIEDFCTSRAQAKTPDEMLLGKPWTNDGWHHFRMRDLLDFLERRKFKALTPNYIGAAIMDMGAKRGFMNLKGKGCNYYKLPKFEDVQKEGFNPETYVNPNGAI